MREEDVICLHSAIDQRVRELDLDASPPPSLHFRICQLLDQICRVQVNDNWVEVCVEDYLCTVSPKTVVVHYKAAGGWYVWTMQRSEKINWIKEGF